MTDPQLRRRLRLALVFIALMGLSSGLTALLLSAEAAGWLWTGGTVPVLLALLAEIATSLRRGEVGLDIVAALSMGAALAFGEPLAGNVVALMYAGGQQLESFAEGRARREMTALLGRVAHTAMRYAAQGLEEVAIERLLPGERLLIRKGEVVPVDGRVARGTARLDQSALTGEPLPVTLDRGAEVASGVTALGEPFDLEVLRPAAESTYAGIVRLVEGAQASRAPMVRMADRYAIWFLLLTVALAGAAWGISGDRLRALAVLVVATPCPLILAVPVAIVSGISRAAGLGVLVKSGGALEGLACVRVAVLDKTGTLTHGRAGLHEIRTVDGFSADELLRLAASLDQASGHVMAATLVGVARARGLALASPTAVVEDPGDGLEGDVDGRHVVVGGSGYVRARSAEGDPANLRAGLAEGMAVVAVAVDGALAGILILADELRPEAPAVLAALRSAGVHRIILASGDRAELVAKVGHELGLDAAHGELTPDAKLMLIRAEQAHGVVLMVGDGVNDAPALAAADVGVAMGARGSAASSEAADVVLLVDQLGRLAQAISLAQRARAIARQSVMAGIGLSLAAMLLAAFGYLPPIQGALTQEAIDVAVILNALRVLRTPILAPVQPTPGVPAAQPFQISR